MNQHSVIFLGVPSKHGDGLYWVEGLRTGKWHYPGFGKSDEFEITPATLKELASNFSSGVKGAELPVDGPSRGGDAHSENEEHDCGWIKSVKLAGDGQHLYFGFDITNPKVREQVDEGSLKYCSSEIDFKWLDPVDNKRKAVLEGMGLTNRPYIKGMSPIQKTAINLSEFSVELADGEHEEKEESHHDDEAHGEGQSKNGGGNPNHGPDGRFTSGGNGEGSSNEQAPDTLSSLIEEANSPGGEYADHSFGAVSDTEAKRIQEATGLDVRGYEHIVDLYAVQHVIKEHGDEKSEAKRGNIAITPEDFKSLESVLHSPDSIEDAGKTKQGLNAIRFQKLIGDNLVCVEEVRTKHKTLALKTFYKRPASAPFDSQESPPPTSETFRGSDNKIIHDNSGQTAGKEEKMPENEKMEMTDNSTAKLGELETKLAESKTREAQYQARLAELESMNRETAKELRMSQVKTRLSAMVTQRDKNGRLAGKITPAIANRVIKLADVLFANGAGVVKLAEKVKLDEKASGDGTDKLDVINELLDVLDNVPDSISMNDDSAQLAEGDNRAEDDDEDALDKAARAKMKENPKLSYKQAVSAADRDRRGAA